jgi:hypothetical protein
VDPEVEKDPNCARPSRGAALAVVPARLRFALERYRARHRTFPDTLDQLLPAEIVELPPDPLSGRPYNYRVTGTGYSLEGTQPPAPAN